MNITELFILFSIGLACYLLYKNRKYKKVKRLPSGLTGKASRFRKSNNKTSYYKEIKIKGPIK